MDDGFCLQVDNIPIEAMLIKKHKRRERGDFCSVFNQKKSYLYLCTPLLRRIAIKNEVKEGLEIQNIEQVRGAYV